MEYWQILRSALGNQQLILPCAAGAIINDGRILLVKCGSSNAMWSIPGGLQQLNESVTDTVVRELHEELGVELEVDRLIGIYSEPRFNAVFPNGDKIQQVLFFFRMKETSLAHFEVQQEEIECWQYFDLNDLPDDILPCCKEKIDDLLNFNGTVLLK